mmetsp:Transcript_45361/g.120295  ORF Transcript_45361/g.120295 Transcript_45361/m.120295 type:complete len:206 (-) Transcript_45361:180-797(-)
MPKSFQRDLLEVNARRTCASGASVMAFMLIRHKSLKTSSHEARREPDSKRTAFTPPSNSSTRPFCNRARSASSASSVSGDNSSTSSQESWITSSSALGIHSPSPSGSPSKRTGLLRECLARTERSRTANRRNVVAVPVEDLDFNPSAFLVLRSDRANFTAMHSPRCSLLASELFAQVEQNMAWQVHGTPSVGAKHLLHLFGTSLS